MTEIGSILALGALLFVKHFLADGPLQTGWQAQKKGVFLHPAGLLHAGVHAGLTGLCLLAWASLAPGAPMDGSLFGAIVIAEFAAHYLIDFTKVQLERRHGWASRPATPESGVILEIRDVRWFFAFLADQLAHSLTYIAILFWIAVAIEAG